MRPNTTALARATSGVAWLVVFYFLFRKARESESPLGSVVFAVVSVVFGGLIIFSFYLWHFLLG